MVNKKTQVARLSILSNSFLIILKLIVGLLTGSVSIISEAIHSSMDLIAAFIAYFSVSVSDNPPDKEHPYGHGKIENISGVIEGFLILIAAAWIIIEAIKKLTGEPFELEVIWIGAVVMVISSVVNFFVARKLYRVARLTRSIALEADALHLRTDVYTSMGVAGGLILIQITGVVWLDPVVAILVALLILFEAYRLIKKAFSPLLDSAWDDHEIQSLKNNLDQMKVNYHDLRTRIAGNYRFIDIHVVLPEGETVKSAHQFCDIIENELSKKYENLSVTIHVEPDQEEEAVDESPR